MLIVTPQPFYEDRGTPIALRHVARALGELGYKVDLLAFPFGRSVQSPGLTIHRCANPLAVRSVPIGFSWRKVMLDIGLGRAFASHLARRHYDIVHAVEEAAYVAAFLCPRHERPFIYDMASAIPQELGHRALFRAQPIQRAITAIEQRVIDRATHVVCSIGLADYVRARAAGTRVSEWRFPVSTPRVDRDQVAALRNELGIDPEQQVLLYSGNFASYQGIDLLLDAFRLAHVRKPRLMLVCVGATGHERTKALSSMSADVASHVRVVPRRPRKEIPLYLDLADCLVSPRAETGNLPLKIFEYMASGTPIVATRGPAHERVLNHGRAVLCDPTAESLASGIVDVMSSPTRAQLISHSASEYARRHCSWEAFVDFVDKTYRAALFGSPAPNPARSVLS